MTKFTNKTSRGLSANKKLRKRTKEGAIPMTDKYPIGMSMNACIAHLSTIDTMLVECVALTKANENMQQTAKLLTLHDLELKRSAIRHAMTWMATVPGHDIAT